MDHFQDSLIGNIVWVVSNKAQAGVLEKATQRGVKATVLSKEVLESDVLLEHLQAEHIDFIVLAGYLRLIPASVIEAYADKIVNIHPALLPKYGGKGMYGDRVHQAVLAAGESKSGITIHFVNARYDEGAILFQATCPVQPTDSPSDLAQRIHALEHAHYPRIVEQLLST